MKTKERKNLYDFLENLLNKANISEYKYIKHINDDIFFFVSPKITRKNFQSDLKLHFFIYCSDVKILTFYCPLIYKLTNKDSAMYTLNAINNTNNLIAFGKIYLNNENSSVISYINRVIFNNMIDDLTTDMLNEYIDAFLISSYEFYNQMKPD